MSAMARKSVHGKKSPEKAPGVPGSVASPGIPSAPPSSYGNQKLGDRIPLIKKDSQRQSSSRFRDVKKADLVKLPNITDVPAKDRPALIVEKLRQCSATFDFTIALNDIRSKDIKRSALNELIEYFSNPNNGIPAQVYPEMVQMYDCNLFRTLSPPLNPNAAEFDPEEDEPTLEAAWPHLGLVYELFLKFLESPDFQGAIAKTYINNHFVENLLELFDSEDPRERDYLKTTLHRVYGKMLNLRSFIRRAMNNVFLRFTLETQKYNGIAELLEILGSVINGFTLPLKPEHKTFLMKVLVPLHRVRSLNAYHPQLSYCIIQFLDKDPSLTAGVLRALFRIWPKVNSPKEVLFLTELEEILEGTDADSFQSVSEMLFTQLAKCVASPHFQVAERSLYFFNSSQLVTFIDQDSERIIPVIFPALFKISKNHWNRAINTLIINALKLLSEINQPVFEACTAKFKLEQQKQSQKDKQRQDRWAAVEKRAMKHPLSKTVPLARPKLPTPLPDSRPVWLDRANALDPLRFDAGAAQPQDAGSSNMRRKSMLPHDESTQAALLQYKNSEHVLSSTPK